MWLRRRFAPLVVAVGLLGGGSVTAACAPLPSPGPQTAAEEPAYAVVGALLLLLLAPFFSDPFEGVCFCPFPGA